MKHTLKWSLFVGVGIAGIVLLLLRLFQPVNYFHLLGFAYSIVASAVLASIVVHKNIHKNIEKRGKPVAGTEKNPKKEIVTQNNPVNMQQNNGSKFFTHFGKFAFLHLHDGRTLRGRFLHLDDKHIVLDYAVDLADESSRVKSLLMLNKNEVRRLEVD